MRRARRRPDSPSLLPPGRLPAIRSLLCPLSLHCCSRNSASILSIGYIRLRPRRTGKCRLLPPLFLSRIFKLTYGSEPANSGQGTNKEARKLQDQDSKALGESQGQPEIERRFQSLRIRESQEQQREPTELSFSPPFGQPSRVLSNLASSDALPAAHPTGDERPGDNSSSRESSPRD